MKNMPIRPQIRNRERGAVAIVVAFTWTALFGVAVLAIDFGYLYAKRRGVQAAADITLKNSMPTWVAGYPTGLSAATIKATTVAGQLGYSSATGDVITTSEDRMNNLFTVNIRRRYPTFVGGLLGMNGKTVTGTAIGHMTGSGGGAAIQALNGAPCAAFPTWGVGFFIQGAPGTSMIVNGSIESGGQAVLQTGSGGTISGTLKTDCPTPLATGGGNFNAGGVTVVGGQTTIASGGGVVVDAIGATLAALNSFCTNGSVFDNSWTGISWASSATCDTPANQIYCAAGLINVAPPGPGMAICPGSRATFISATTVQFGANTEINLLPATGAPSNIVAAAFGSAGATTCATQDIFFGSAGTFTIGSAVQPAVVYAPSGCVGAGGGGVGGFTMFGSIVAQNIDFQPSPGPAWTFNGTGGGGGGGAWTLYK